MEVIDKCENVVFGTFYYQNACFILKYDTAAKKHLVERLPQKSMQECDIVCPETYFGLTIIPRRRPTKSRKTTVSLKTTPRPEGALSTRIVVFGVLDKPFVDYFRNDRKKMKTYVVSVFNDLNELTRKLGISAHIAAIQAWNESEPIHFTSADVTLDNFAEYQRKVKDDYGYFFNLGALLSYRN